jgi:hypothetical protein
MNTASIRVGVWFLAVFGTVMLLQSKPVSDALLLFCTIGLVPGTDITLSPDGTIGCGCAVCISSKRYFSSSVISFIGTTPP